MLPHCVSALNWLGYFCPQDPRKRYS